MNAQRLIAGFVLIITTSPLSADDSATFFFDPADFYEVRPIDPGEDSSLSMEGGMFKLHQIWNEVAPLRSWLAADRPAIDAFLQSLTAGEGIGQFDIDLTSSANATAWGQTLPNVMVEEVFAPPGWTTQLQGLRASWTADDPGLHIRPDTETYSDARQFGFRLAIIGSGAFDASETIWFGGYNWLEAPLAISFDEFAGGYASIDARPGSGFEATLLLSQLRLIGDFSGNGIVEQADLDLVLSNWGQDASTPPPAWINDLPSGFIDQAELDRVLVNWGQSLPLGGGLSASGAVPEPISAVLLVLSFALWWLPRHCLSRR